MDPADRRKTKFFTPGGLLEFNVMPFGLCNFVIKCEISLCYLNDVIFGRALKEHETRLRLVLDSVEKPRLILNCGKCWFAARQPLVLGHLVSKVGVRRPDLREIEAVSAFKPPQSTRELRKFLGLGLYFLRFVARLADIVLPFPRVLKKMCP